MERDIATAPRRLPAIGNKYQLRIDGTQTAPSLSNYAQNFSFPVLSPMTRRKNQSLADQMKLLNMILHGGRHLESSVLMDDSINEIQTADASKFDKNYHDLLSLIGK
jgi:hypothetical protein